MTDFRGGKPWALLEVTSPKTQTSGLQAVQWDTMAGDGDLTWPGASNGEVVIVKRGLYDLKLAVARDAVATSAEATAGIALNGVRITGTRSPASTTAVYMSCSTTRMLSAGDVISALVLLSNTATAGFNELATSMAITRIGPWRYTG